MPLFPNAIQSRLDALKSRLNRKALAASKQAEKAPAKVPYTSTTEVKTVEFKPRAAMLETTVLSYHECKSHEKMNNRRKHRQDMKKFHKKQARMNKQYRCKHTQN